MEAKREEKHEEKIEARRKEDLVTVSAGSIEELIKKAQSVAYEAMSDNVQTPQEKLVGQSVDFSI